MQAWLRRSSLCDMSNAHASCLVFLLLFGCSSSSDGGAAGASGSSGSSTAGTGGSPTSGGTGGASASGSGGKPSSGGGATGSGGKGHDLYGDVGTPGTATVDCDGTKCAPQQVCCELMSGFAAKCLDTYEACAELASTADSRPPAYGCASATQCSGGLCCGRPPTGISAVRYIATSCRSACEAGEDSICNADSDCTAPEMCVMTGGLGVCF